MTRIIDNIVYQHAENACALLWQWQRALSEPHYDFNDLCLLENSIDANLDGLTLAGDAATPFIREMHDAGDEGAVFVSAMQALCTDKPCAFMDQVAACQESEQTRYELSLALTWMADQATKPILDNLAEQPGPTSLLLRLSVGLAHRQVPDHLVRSGLSHEDTRVRTAALRAVADLPDQRLRNDLPAQASHEPRECLQLARALVSQGEHGRGYDLLESLALSETEQASDAVRLVMLGAEPERSRKLLQQLDTLGDRQRDVIRGLGLLGDPGNLDRLLQACINPQLARLAGESISMITGARLSEHDLDRDDEVGMATSLLNDDPTDDNVRLDEDENLPWPDSDRLADWCLSAVRDTSADMPLLCGYQRTAELLQHVLQQGLQRQRSVAADLMKSRQPGKPYCNTCLPTSRQRHFMTAMDYC
ncbi:TIGR02270 family protein [Granulosicoccus sp. 3-233]|uniref:TIGR02270 family protein n=1 Tax=Granulosicoccus sp. 3-233 TaxID=3417969 RepID=UPI003D33D972